MGKKYEKERKKIWIIWIQNDCEFVPPYVIELHGEVEHVEVDWEVVSDILPVIRPHQFIKHQSFKCG